jgi:hypothetical protein
MNWKLSAIAMVASLMLGGVARTQDFVEATLNTDWQNRGLKRAEYNKAKAELENCIEAHVVFKVNQRLSTIWKHLQDPGTLGKALPFIEPNTYRPTKVDENDSSVHYKVALTITPLQNDQLPKLKKAEANIDLYINKGARAEDALALRWELDPKAKNDWKRASSHVYAVDLHNGRTLVAITSSTISNYETPRHLKLKVAEYVLNKMKASITAWAEGLKD